MSRVRTLLSGVVAAAVMSVGAIVFVGAPAQACTPTTCDAGGTTYHYSKVGPRWVGILKRYVYVRDGHYHNHKLSAAAMKIVTKSRLTKLHAYWAKYPAGKVYWGSSTRRLMVNRTMSSDMLNTHHAYIQVRWWGVKAWFDAYVTDRVLAYGVVTSTLLAFLTLRFPLAGLVAAALGAVTAAWVICRNHYTGATTFYGFGAGPFYVWACHPW